MSERVRENKFANQTNEIRLLGGGEGLENIVQRRCQHVFNQNSEKELAQLE